MPLRRGDLRFAALASPTASCFCWCGRQYDTLTTTCRNSKPLTGSLSVASVADCPTRCDAYARLHRGERPTCFLKSYCEGDVGACSGWCGSIRPADAAAAAARRR